MYCVKSSRYIWAGILQKAEALYHLGDFEHALMYYHRGLRIRPEMQEFRLGVQKSQEAIENTIGSKSLVHPYVRVLDELTFSSTESAKSKFILI